MRLQNDKNCESRHDIEFQLELFSGVKRLGGQWRMFTAGLECLRRPETGSIPGFALEIAWVDSALPRVLFGVARKISKSEVFQLVDLALIGEGKIFIGRCLIRKMFFRWFIERLGNTSTEFAWDAFDT